MRSKTANAVVVCLMIVSGCSVSKQPEWAETSVGRAVKIWYARPPTTARTDPKYPEVLRKERIEGYANVYVVADEQGKVTSIERVETNNEEFARAAEAALTNWRFVPQFVDGQPVKALYLLTFRFDLH